MVSGIFGSRNFFKFKKKTNFSCIFFLCFFFYPTRTPLKVKFFLQNFYQNSLGFFFFFLSIRPTLLTWAKMYSRQKFWDFFLGRFRSLNFLPKLGLKYFLSSVFLLQEKNTQEKFLGRKILLEKMLEIKKNPEIENFHKKFLGPKTFVGIFGSRIFFCRFLYLKKIQTFFELKIS